MRRFLSLVLLVFCVPCTTLASRPIQIGPDIKFLNIDRQVEVLFDPTHKLVLADIVSDEYSSRFHPHTTRGFNFGMIDDVIWLRFKLNILPVRSEAEGLLLGIDKTTFPYVTLYLPTESQSPKACSPISGSYLNRTENRTLRYRYPVFKIPHYLPQERYLYMSITPVNAKQHSSSNFNLFLSDTDSFIHRTWVETAFYYLIFGVLLSMIAYNLFLSFFLRDRVYYFYVGYVAFILFYIFLRSGFHLVAGFPALTNLILPTVAVAFLLGIIFSQSFLATQQYCPIIHRVMWGIMGLAGGVLLAQGLGFPKLANTLMHIIGAGGPIVAITAGFIRLHQGYKPARYYLAAWLSLLTGVISLSLVGLGVLPKKFFIFNFMAIGSMLEAVLLSTALGDRIRILRQEKRKLQKKERRLIELSITDELTGLFNKRWFSSKFQSEIRHSKRFRNPCPLSSLTWTGSRTSTTPMDMPPETRSWQNWEPLSSKVSGRGISGAGTEGKSSP